MVAVVPMIRYKVAMLCSNMHDFFVVTPNRGHDKLTILIFIFIAVSIKTVLDITFFRVIIFYTLDEKC